MASQGWRHFPYARLVSMHDGDTCEVEVDSGFGAYHRVAVRLFGLSAPEVSGKERDMGLKALYVARELAGNSSLALWTWKASFNRYVGRISLLPDKRDLARDIIALGAARAWDGKTERPAFAEFPISIEHREQETAEYDRLLARDFRP